MLMIGTTDSGSSGSEGSAMESMARRMKRMREMMTPRRQRQRGPMMVSLAPVSRPTHVLHQIMLPGAGSNGGGCGSGTCGGSGSGSSGGGDSGESGETGAETKGGAGGKMMIPMPMDMGMGMGMMPPFMPPMSMDMMDYPPMPMPPAMEYPMPMAAPKLKELKDDKCMMVMNVCEMDDKNVPMRMMMKKMKGELLIAMRSEV